MLAPRVDKAATQREAEAKRLARAFDKVVRTKEGLRVFQYVMDICGYHESSVLRQMPGDVLPFATVYNDAHRAVWGKIRKQIPNDVLYHIEIERELADATNDHEDDA